MRASRLCRVRIQTPSITNWPPCKGSKSGLTVIWSAPMLCSSVARAPASPQLHAVARAVIAVVQREADGRYGREVINNERGYLEQHELPHDPLLLCHEGRGGEVCEVNLSSPLVSCQLLRVDDGQDQC